EHSAAKLTVHRPAEARDGADEQAANGERQELRAIHSGALGFLPPTELPAPTWWLAAQTRAFLHTSLSRWLWRQSGAGIPLPAPRLRTRPDAQRTALGRGQVLFRGDGVCTSVRTDRSACDFRPERRPLAQSDAGRVDGRAPG